MPVVGWRFPIEETQRQVLVFSVLRGAKTGQTGVGLRERPGLSDRSLLQSTSAGLPSRRLVSSYLAAR